MDGRQRPAEDGSADQGAIGDRSEHHPGPAGGVAGLLGDVLNGVAELL
jgi:hypothetical protein